ncbi:DUF2608 domain-containing protein [Paraneptunicella aestuarii]|uniref:DUF2608 domain-containing protein n=1 Tax=Paraneptunicella aestuarii TaxID=2831148 RepID=UPI001E58BEE8|nr:DUF2608 domain-containing protein [Paraneptunicella aestuarii]UAA39551.1 DUF2608 domain-containing protein [Paraneptunicella aestuarii]
MKTVFRQTLFAASLVLPLGACAATPQSGQSSNQISSDSFNTVLEYVKQWNKPGNTLVASDNDDTLTMMACPDLSSPKTCQFLGGAAWFSWQNGLLKVPGKQAGEVADNFDELLEISALLFSMNEMDYTEDAVPNVLQELAAMGVKTMVATARGNENISATEQQFDDLNVTGFDNLLDYFSKQAPNLGDDIEPNPYLNCTNNKAISYRNGVMYLVGQNKGQNLQCFIHEYNQDKPASLQITNLVFIDDTLKNVEDVTVAFQKSGMEFVSIHYTALQEHKDAFIKGDKAAEYQQAATKRWEILKQAMDSQLLKPVAK